MNVSTCKILLWNRGDHSYLASRFARDAAQVWSYTPILGRQPKNRDDQIDMGKKGVEVIDDFEAYKDKADLIVFPDEFSGEICNRMWIEGKRAFGSGLSAEYEIDKILFLKTLKKLGLPVIKTVITKGLDAAIKNLTGQKDKWIKSPYNRGDFDTKHFQTLETFMPWFHYQRNKLGQGVSDSIELLIQDSFPAVVETGCDRYIVKGKRTPTGTIGYECYDDKTEILTDKGWKYFKDLDKTEKVLTLDITDKRHYKIQFEKPTKYIRYDYSGNMLEIKNKTTDLFVTPNHNLFVQVGSQNLINGKKVEGTYNGIKKEFITGKKERMLVRADSIDLNKQFCMPHPTSVFYQDINRKKTHIKIGNKKLTRKQYATLMGLYLSEGSFSRATKYTVISQEKYVKEFGEALKNIPFDFRRIKAGFGCYDQFLCEYMSKFGKSKDKYVPEEIKNSSKENRKIFLDMYCLGDGSYRDIIKSTRNNKREKISRLYYTISKQMADDLLELIILNGGTGSIRVSKRENHNDMYVVCELPVFKKHYINKGQANWVDYKGEVFCVTVPRHIIMVRRNGKPIWCGNCKDKWYIYRVVKAMPKILDNIDAKMETIFQGEVKNNKLAKGAYSGAYSTEVRINDKGESRFTDATCRFGSPPGEGICETYTTFTQDVFDVADGKMPKMEYNLEYGAMINLISSWNEDQELCVQYPKEMERNVKLRHSYKHKGNMYCVPNESSGYFGCVVAQDKTLKGAVTKVNEMARQVIALDLEYQHIPLGKAEKLAHEGKRFGVEI